MDAHQSFLAGCTALALLCGANGLRAAFPERTVHILVGAEPGGGTDFLARLIAAKLSDKWGQAVVVENKPGADNTIAADVIAHTAPDGYAVLIMNANQTITPNLPQYQHLNFDPIKSFEPIVSIGEFPDVLDINPQLLPVNSMKELIEYVKAHPGKLNYSSSGTGSTEYFSMQYLAKSMQLQMASVAYKGAGPGMIALVGGETSLMFASAAASLAQLKAGKIRALAVNTNVRVPALKDVPTIEETTGIKDYDLGNWYGFLAPKGTPKEIVRKMHDDIATIVKSDDVQKKVFDQGFITHIRTPEEFETFMRNDIAKWGKIYKLSNE